MNAFDNKELVKKVVKKRVVKKEVEVVKEDKEKKERGKVYIASMNLRGARGVKLDPESLNLNVTSAQAKLSLDRRDFSPMTPIEGGYKGYWNFESRWQSGKIFEGLDEKVVKDGGRLKWLLRGGILRVRERGYCVLVLKDMRRREIWIILVVERRCIVRSIMI